MIKKGLTARDSEYEFEATVHPLIPCVSYEFSVFASSHDDIHGPISYTNDTAGEIRKIISYFVYTVYERF